MQLAADYGSTRSGITSVVHSNNNNNNIKHRTTRPGEQLLYNQMHEADEDENDDDEEQQPYKHKHTHRKAYEKVLRIRREALRIQYKVNFWRK